MVCLWYMLAILLHEYFLFFDDKLIFLNEKEIDAIKIGGA